MNSTFSSFQQDLALEQDSRHCDDEEGEHITHADLRPKKPAENEGGLKNIGLAIMVIFQAKRSALRKAMADLEAESAVSASLRSLIKHVETADTDDQGDLATARMREVYRPFLDKIIKKSDPDKETAFLVLEWLLLKFHYRTLMVRALGDDLSSANDKKRKLAVLLAIENAIDTQNRPRSAAIRKEDASKPKSKPKSRSKLVDDEHDKPVMLLSNDVDKPVEPLADGKTLAAWMASLATIVQSDGTMTRLTSLAMEIAIEISRTLADQTLQEIKSAEDKERTRKPALVVELDAGDENKSDGTNAKDTRSFGLGFVKGMKAMHTIIKYFLMILENIPVGQATAIAVQTCLIPTLSETEALDMKTKIIAILDNPSEISVGSANVASSYMAAFPELFVPALLTGLHRGGQEQNGLSLKDKADVRRIMNSLHIVDAMAERQFFGMVLSAPANDLRRKLEDLIIDLFREKDISIRITLGQIVASLDPTKVIDIYAPEISSPNSILRARAESVLIECMLSQRRDTSMGDGFVVFLEYIRRVGRSRASHFGTPAKIKTPSQLLANIQPSQLNLGPPNAVSALFALLSDTMEHQGELTEEMVEAALEASDESLDDLRLTRLVPLSILKILPTEQLQEQVHALTLKDGELAGINERIFRILRSRFENADEFGSVRKQAEELAGNLFPSLLSQHNLGGDR
ncbi:hypothetical protein BGW39_005845 [Mortierella sp. 14UC]|nr:hypothetical protein BGW39_005845 [Mortierella sp. 14UC]